MTVNYDEHKQMDGYAENGAQLSLMPSPVSNSNTGDSITLTLQCVMSLITCLFWFSSPTWQCQATCLISSELALLIVKISKQQ